MGSWLLILTLVPLIAFVIIDAYMGLKKGIYTAIGLAVVTTVVFLVMLGEIEWEAIMVVVLMILTGLLSIKNNDPLIFKLQPFITGIVSVIVLSYFQFFDTPLAIKYLPKMKHMLTPEMQNLIENQEFLSLMINLNLYMIIWMFAHALIMGLAALKWSNKMWILAKALGVPFVIVMSLLTNIISNLLVN